MHQDIDAFEGKEQIATRLHVPQDEVDRPLTKDRRRLGSVADQAPDRMSGIQRGQDDGLADEARRAGDQQTHAHQDTARRDFGLRRGSRKGCPRAP